LDANGYIQIKAAESPITRIFGGKFRSTLRAPQQKDSVIVEDWRSLRLDIQVYRPCFYFPLLQANHFQREQIHTIRDALSFISAPQSVSVTHPSRPGITVEASQQVLIEALPPILVLHLKRFLYDTSVRGVEKVGKQVRFAEELEVGGEVMVPLARKTPTRYKLFGGKLNSLSYTRTS
jgi:ubiquitin carboxyl-terminal hydrolase 10